MKKSFIVFALCFIAALGLTVNCTLAQRRGGGMRGFRSNAASFSPSRTNSTRAFRSNANSITANRSRIKGLGRSTASGPRRYAVYKKTNARTGQVYYGRTSGTGSTRSIVARRDHNHHMNKAGYSKAVPIRSSTNKAAVRGLEDKLIAKNTQRGRNGNAIRGISSRNPNRQRYHLEARKLTRKLD